MSSMVPRALSLVLLILALGPAAAHAAPQTISLAAPNPIIAGTTGNFFVYSLTVSNSFGLLPGGLPSSSPGAIADDLVVYTGSNNGAVNANNTPALCGAVNT